VIRGVGQALGNAPAMALGTAGDIGPEAMNDARELQRRPDCSLTSCWSLAFSIASSSGGERIRLTAAGV
jgi:hypothetical protein